MRRADPLVRNNVTVTGRPDGTPIVFAHGFGGTKESWRFVAPAFEADHRVVLVDHMGAGIIGVISTNQRPDLFRQLIPLGASPRYIDTDDDVGGFSEQAIDDLFTSMDSNYSSHSRMAIMPTHGHVTHLSAPETVIAHIRAHLA